MRGNGWRGRTVSVGGLGASDCGPDRVHATAVRVLRRRRRGSLSCDYVASGGGGGGGGQRGYHVAAPPLLDLAVHRVGEAEALEGFRALLGAADGDAGDVVEAEEEVLIRHQAREHHVHWVLHHTLGHRGSVKCRNLGYECRHTCTGRVTQSSSIPLLPAWHLKMRQNRLYQVLQILLQVVDACALRPHSVLCMRKILSEAWPMVCTQQQVNRR